MEEVILFPIALLISITFLVISYMRRKVFFLGDRFFSLSLFIGLIITFLFCLAAIFHNPYWIDNGTKERMVFPDHLFWAFLAASNLQFLIVPGVVGLLYVVRYYLHKSQSQNHPTSP